MRVRAMKTFILYGGFEVCECPRSWEAVFGMILHIGGFGLYMVHDVTFSLKTDATSASIVIVLILSTSTYRTSAL